MSGGSSAPTSQTITQTNIPEYLAPYASNLLNAAQSVVFNPAGTGFNQYQAYGGTYDAQGNLTNPQQAAQAAVAGFSPLQQQAQSTAANMQVPGQYGQATNIVGNAAQGSLNTGLQLGRQSTDPNAVQQYMDPYLQKSLDPQIALLQQQQGIGHMNNLAAQTQAGAFGGSRADVQNALESQSDQMAMSNLIGQGYNTAYGNAINQMNAANQAAMQGYQNYGAQGMNLANLGGQNLAAQQGIANMQNTFGGQQQQNQQQVINQEIQNYANAQQYPYMQLGFMNSLLRGLPTQQTSTDIYQAPPSTISQLGGLGTAALGATAAYNTATKGSAGGQVKSMADGGAAIPMSMMSDQQLNQVQQNPVSSPMAKINAQGLEQLHGYLQGNPQAAQMMRNAPPSQGMPAPGQAAAMPPYRSGVAAIGTGNMTQMAGGGIIALAGGGDDKDKDRYPTHEEAVAAFNAAYPTPNYTKPEERGPVSQAFHDLMVQFHMLPDNTPGMVSPESQRASVYGTSQIGHADGGPIRMGVGGVLEGLATANNISRLSDVPYIFDAVNSAKMGNYGDLIGSVVNAALPIGPALATYSADLNKNEDSDLNKHQYVQGHFGRTQRTWANGLAQGGRIHPGTISPEQQRASVYGGEQLRRASGGVARYAGAGVTDSDLQSGDAVFKNAQNVDNKDVAVDTAPTTGAGLPPIAPAKGIDFESTLAKLLAEQGSDKFSMKANYESQAEENRKSIQQAKDLMLPMAAMKMGLTMMQSPTAYTGNKLSALLGNIGAGGQAGLASATASMKDINEQQKDLQKGLLEAAKQDELRHTQVTDKMIAAYNTSLADKERQRYHDQAMAAQQASLDQAKLLSEERLKQSHDEFIARMDAQRKQHEATLQSLGSSRDAQDYNNKQSHWANSYDKALSGVNAESKIPGSDLYGTDPKILDRMAYERAYRLMAPTTRKTLELKSPDEIFPLAAAKPTQGPGQKVIKYGDIVKPAAE